MRLITSDASSDVVYEWRSVHVLPHKICSKSFSSIRTCLACTNPRILERVRELIAHLKKSSRKKVPEKSSFVCRKLFGGKTFQHKHHFAFQGKKVEESRKFSKIDIGPQSGLSQRTQTRHRETVVLRGRDGRQEGPGAALGGKQRL